MPEPKVRRGPYPEKRRHSLIVLVCLFEPFFYVFLNLTAPGANQAAFGFRQILWLLQYVG